MSGNDIEAGRAYVKLAIQDAQFRKGLAGAQKLLENFGNGVQVLGRAMAGVGAIATGMGAAIMASLNPAIQAASSLGETVSKAGQIFGKESMPQLLAFAETAADTFGQSKQQALDAAATFAIFGKSAGLSGDALVGFSTKLVTLASDFASFYDKSPEEAIVAIGAALRGESEPIRQFGVLLDDATLRAKAMELGITKTTKDALKPFQRVLAAQAVILAQTTDAQGDYIRTSNSLANQQRSIAAQWKDIQAAIGEALLPTMQGLMGRVSEVVKVVADWISKNAELVGTISKVAAGLSAVGAVFTTAGVAIIGAGAAATALAGGLSAVATAAGLLLTPVGAVTAALGVTLVGSFAVVADKSEEFRDTVVASFTGILETAKLVGTGLSDALQANDMQLAWEIAMQGLKVLWGQTLDGMLDMAIQWAADLREIILSNIRPIIEFMSDPGGFMFGKGVDWLEDYDKRTNPAWKGARPEQEEGMFLRRERELAAQQQKLAELQAKAIAKRREVERQAKEEAAIEQAMRDHRTAPVKAVDINGERVFEIKSPEKQDWNAVRANRDAPVKGISLPDEDPLGLAEMARIESAAAEALASLAMRDEMPLRQAAAGVPNVATGAGVTFSAAASQAMAQGSGSPMQRVAKLNEEQLRQMRENHDTDKRMLEELRAVKIELMGGYVT